MKRNIRGLVLFCMLTVFIKTASSQGEEFVQKDLFEKILEKQASDIKAQIKKNLEGFEAEEKKVDVDLSGLGIKICPVMKPYKKTDPEIFVNYKGERIYLCCDLCVKFFKKDPKFFYDRMKKEKAEYLRK